MRPVRLNRALTLEAPLRAPDGAGGVTGGWLALGKLWARIEPRAPRAAAADGAAHGRLRLRITLRAAPPGSSMRPAPGQRLRAGARAFAIHAVRETDPEGRYLTCEAEEELVP